MSGMPSASSRRSRTWTSKRRAPSCEKFSGPDCSADSKSASAAQDPHGPGGPTVWIPESPRPPPAARGTCYTRVSTIVAEGENVDMQIALELPEDIAKRLELAYGSS